MNRLTPRFPRRIAAALLATAVLASAPLFAHQASASLSSCRTDPIVKLSNGKQLKLVATIFDSSGSVSTVTYNVYIPSGVAVSGETMTGGWAAGKEKIIVYTTNPANTYTTKFYVTDSNKSINVTGATTLATSGGSTISSKSVTGFANSTISVQVTG